MEPTIFCASSATKTAVESEPEQSAIRRSTCGTGEGYPSAASNAATADASSHRAGRIIVCNAAELLALIAGSIDHQIRPILRLNPNLQIARRLILPSAIVHALKQPRQTTQHRSLSHHLPGKRTGDGPHLGLLWSG